MKKIFIVTIIFIIILIGIFFLYDFNQTSNKNENHKIDEQIVNNDLEPETNKYIDNNPIKLGLYKYYGRGKERELINEYTATWKYHTDISSFEVFYVIEPTIAGTQFQSTFKEYLNKYENINQYKIGYKVSFLTTNQEFSKNILSPKDTEEFYDHLEIYLYDDYHRTPGVWYSHTTEEEYNDETILTSIKLTAGKLVDEIISDITVTAFTYDYDDFDEDGNYRGISKYTIVVKNKKTN